MRYHAVACDYDGTLAKDGVLDETTLAALVRTKESGRKLLLVTGRELPDLRRVCPNLDLFDRDRAPAMPMPGASRNAARPVSEPGTSVPPDGSGSEFDEDEPERLRALATRFDGNVAKMSRELGITRQALYRRLERHGIEIRR